MSMPEVCSIHGTAFGAKEIWPAPMQPPPPVETMPKLCQLPSSYCTNTGPPESPEQMLGRSPTPIEK